MWINNRIEQNQNQLHILVTINMERIRQGFIAREKETEKMYVDINTKVRWYRSGNDINDSIMLSLSLFSSFAVLLRRGWWSQLLHDTYVYERDQQYTLHAHIYVSQDSLSATYSSTIFKTTLIQGKFKLFINFWHFYLNSSNIHWIFI